MADDPKKDPRLVHGLIPMLVAQRVKGERERRMKLAASKAAREAASPADGLQQKKKKRGWFG